jgi:hypothetical protein
VWRCFMRRHLARAAILVPVLAVVGAHGIKWVVG